MALQESEISGKHSNLEDEPLPEDITAQNCSAALKRALCLKPGRVL